MMPAGPLMKEHRIIEEMIEHISREQRRVRTENTVDPVFIETAVDFIRTYADQCHHGKEEKMLFRELGKKELSPEHEKIMNELVEDHKYGRKVTGELEKANEDYKKGEEQALEAIHECLKKLADLYPGHID
ncbi:MAG: cation-binding protein, partial [Candidatus Omnitrophica bacterium]|nr:cation-binding protein [Candidatus Omnitrophota bacterium]